MRKRLKIRPIGKVLHALRIACKLPRSVLAARIGVTVSCICQIESGKRENVGWRTVAAWAQACGQTTDDIARMQGLWQD